MKPLILFGMAHANRLTNVRTLLRAPQMAPAITQQGQWYRLLTPIVLHGSFTHLAVNSMSFSSVGPLVREEGGGACVSPFFVRLQQQ